MKILHIFAGAEQGGAETFCLDAIKALHDAGITQKALCRPHPHVVKALDERGIEHTPLTFNRFVKPFEQRKIAKAVAEYQPDVVHCWMSRASSFMPAVNVPVLGWFGGYYDLKNYKNCDFYMGVTRDIVRHIDESTGKPERSFVVHTFGTLEEDDPVSRTDFDVPEEAKVVLLLSRMHWKKGVDTLLEAALKLDPSIYFLMAGDGPDLAKYQAMCTKMGLDERVRFLGWRNDRSALLNISDVCVLPSRYEPFGTVIAEAWYAKVPLVATKAAGAKQYVTHEQDGMLCEIDDADTLAAHIQAIVSDEGLQASLIEKGQKTYNELFSREVVTKSLIEAYQKMIDELSEMKKAS